MSRNVTQSGLHGLFCFIGFCSVLFELFPNFDLFFGSFDFLFFLVLSFGGFLGGGSITQKSKHKVRYVGRFGEYAR